MAVSFPRVEAALGGTSIAAADEETLQILVDGQVREDTEIEFKSATYGTSDRSRRDLAVDVAALANSLGGVIFLGVREEGGIAVELSPVPLDEGEEIRMRQILASRVAPPPQIEILRLELRDDPAHGYCLLAVPVSPWRPHAVRVDTALRYPRRDGPHIRYLSETEVADAYRNRFTAEADQAQRLTQIRLEALERVSTDHQLWLTVALVPDVPGVMHLDRAALQGFRAFAEKYNGGFGSMVFGGFDFATGLRRVILRTGPEQGLSTVAHAELHTDGSAFAATSLWNERDQQPEGRTRRSRKGPRYAARPARDRSPRPNRAVERAIRFVLASRAPTTGPPPAGDCGDTRLTAIRSAWPGAASAEQAGADQGRRWIFRFVSVSSAAPKATSGSVNPYVALTRGDRSIW
jgi:hypothetical protein